MLSIVSPLILGLFTHAGHEAVQPTTWIQPAASSIQLSSDADSDGGLWCVGEVLGWATNNTHITLNIDGKLFQIPNPEGIIPVPDIGSTVLVFDFWKAPADSPMDYLAAAFVVVP